LEIALTDLPQPTSELEAVNVLLDVIGQAPILTLVPPIGVDAAKAQKKLAWISRTVQTEGWQFNSEENFPLARNENNEIVIPLNTIRVGACRSILGDVTQRGNRLYDRCKHTFTFDRDITVDIVLQLPFDELPDFARQYVTIRAAREFQQTTPGALDQDRFTAEHEARARADMVRADAKNSNLNILNGMGTFKPGHVLRR
jgi:Autographiviridae tail tubular protein Gp11